MLLKLLFALAILVAVFLVVVALQPADYRYSRSVTIAAPRDVPFALVNDLRKAPEWNPWAKAECDPAIKRTFDGAPAGVGAVYAWDGNAAAGAGRMTITESRTGELVRLREEYVKPVAATCTMEFTFQPTGGQTVVTWTMSGRKNFFFKALHLFMGRVIVGEFDQGLADLKRLSEAVTPSKA